MNENSERELREVTALVEDRLNQIASGDVIEQSLPSDPLLRQSASFHHRLFIHARLILSSRKLQLEAEDIAIDETQYFLDKALENGRVDFAVYMKARTPSIHHYFALTLLLF